MCVCQGWSSAYTVEAVILQISATLVKGKARIAFSQAKVGLVVGSRSWDVLPVTYMQGESYTLSKAQHAYKSLVKIHEKSGKWTLMLSPSLTPHPPHRLVHSTKGGGLGVQVLSHRTCSAHIICCFSFSTHVYCTTRESCMFLH